MFWADPNDGFLRSAISAAFPALADSQIVPRPFARGLGLLPAGDVAIATLWATAYSSPSSRIARAEVLHDPGLRADVLPGGHLYTLAEESYRLGLYGLCNTEHMLRLYERATAEGYVVQPAVDRPSSTRKAGRFERTLIRSHRVRVRAARPLAELLGARGHSRSKS